MSYAACHEELKESYVTRAGLPSHCRRVHSGLRAGASPERRMVNRGCPNPCRRDDGPVDCKTQSVRRRLAEELGCCGCTKVQTPCLVTEDTSTSCRRRPAAPTYSPEPNDNAAATYVDPVDQIINEGLMQQKKNSSRRRSTACSASRPRDRSVRERRTRPSTANNLSYQPDFFDDQADMDNWQQHWERKQHDASRGRPSSPPAPSSNRLAFEPYVDDESYSEAAVGTPNNEIQPALQDENDDRRQNIQQELERLNEHRSYLMECLERETKIIELMREYQQLKRVSAQLHKQQQPSVDDRERLQRLIDEEKRKLADFQRQPQQQNEPFAAAPSGTYEIPSDLPARSPTPSPSRNRESECDAASSPPRQRRRLSYRPPSTDTDTEDECRAPPPRRRLLVVRPPSPSDSSDDGEDVNEYGRGTPAATSRCPAEASGASRSQESSPRPHSSLQDSLMYYYRAIRNGALPMTANAPQQTSNTWPTGGR